MAIEKRRRQFQRMYAGAKASRLNEDWTSTPTSSNYELRTSLRTLRARARQQARDNSHFKKFLTMVRSNVVGPQGFQLQVRARKKDGTLNVELNRTTEEAFWEWGHKENCTVSGKLSWLDAQKLFATTLARDGEVLVQKIYPKGNPFGFALKFIDVSYLDETFTTVLPNGNRIIMSVEVDKNDKPVAYHLRTPSTEFLFTDRRLNEPVRVPASEIIHAFLTFEDESQTRGVTWFHTALLDAKNLNDYKNGVITSAKAAAYSFATISPPETAEFSENDLDEQGNPIPIDFDVEPLTVHELPPGYTMNAFDPKQPTQNHPEFYKSMMMSLAIGLDVNYFNFAGDMAAVNYSSARVGLREERDVWESVQAFMTEHFCREVYHDWLEAAYLTSRLDVLLRDLQELRNPLFRGRGWAYVDPQKEVAANVNALENKLTTWTEVLADQGKDLVSHLETLSAEQALAKTYGIDLSIAGKFPPAQSQPNKEDDEE